MPCWRGVVDSGNAVLATAEVVSLRRVRFESGATASEEMQRWREGTAARKEAPTAGGDATGELDGLVMYESMVMVFKSRWGDGELHRVTAEES